MDTRRVVNAPHVLDAPPGHDDGPGAVTRACLVWIDAREAFLVRWRDDRASVGRVESEVPAHHRSTGHVRHDPGIRHGGGGPKQTAGEPHRLEHLERFIDQVADLVGEEERLIILGPGTVREHLERSLRDHDHRMGRARTITCEPASRLTERQLVARLRELLGASPRRRTVGSYRWTTPPARRASKAAVPLPRRVAEKRTSRAATEQEAG